MKHILLPTDFSENSWNAIVYAMQLFKEQTCTFHLLNTYTPVVYHAEYVMGYPAQFGLGDTIRNTSQQQLDELVLRVSNAFEVNLKHTFETAARFNTLVPCISEFLETQPIDLIIMGTKGATGAQEVLFGSNTVHVINAISCSVLAIPSNFKYKAPYEILFPTDLKVDHQHIEAKILQQITLSNHSRVHLMHVSTGNALNDVQKENKLQLESSFKNTVMLFHDVTDMSIPEAIDKFQTTYEINLLVMVNNKHSFFENLFFKNTVHQIGFHLNIPFLVIPSKK